MAANNRAIIRKLNRLYRFCKAGERGFLVVSENASNRGLKVVLKSFAHQRAVFAKELKEEIHRLGDEISERRSIRGIIHRGRINIRAALTIGPHNVENVILGEALNGEKVVLKAYRQTLDEDLSDETQAIVKRQYDELLQVRDQIELLRGFEGRQLVVRLFDTEQDVQVANQALEEAGFDQSAIEVADVKQVTSVYEGQGSTVSETLLSGAFGGAIWGTVIGALAGAGLLLFPEMATMMGGYMITWAGVTVAGAFFGALFGAILGFLIGHGTAEEDAYLYDDSVEYGSQLVRLLTSEDRAMEASRILHQVNAAARTRGAQGEVLHAEQPSVAQD
jgi:uncharacterized protein (TIGR02284 family)